jgi:heat shock protein HslJ
MTGVTDVAPVTAPVAAGTTITGVALLTSTAVVTTAAPLTPTASTGTVEGTAEVPAPAAGATAVPQLPLAGDWVWVNTTMSDGTVLAPAGEERFGMRFLPNGRIDIYAGCNRMVGTYALREETLRLHFGGASNLNCGPDSQSRAFFEDLWRTTDVLLQGNDLYLSLQLDSGTIHFTQQQ